MIDMMKDRGLVSMIDMMKGRGTSNTRCGKSDTHGERPETSQTITGVSQINRMLDWRQVIPVLE